MALTGIDVPINPSIKIDSSAMQAAIDSAAKGTSLKIDNVQIDTKAAAKINAALQKSINTQGVKAPDYSGIFNTSGYEGVLNNITNLENRFNNLGKFKSLDKNSLDTLIQQTQKLASGQDFRDGHDSGITVYIRNQSDSINEQLGQLEYARDRYNAIRSELEEKSSARSMIMNAIRSRGDVIPKGLESQLAQTENEIRSIFDNIINPGISSGNMSVESLLDNLNKIDSLMNSTSSSKNRLFGSIGNIFGKRNNKNIYSDYSGRVAKKLTETKMVEDWQEQLAVKLGSALGARTRRKDIYGTDDMSSIADRASYIKQYIASLSAIKGISHADIATLYQTLDLLNKIPTSAKGSTTPSINASEYLSSMFKGTMRINDVETAYRDAVTSGFFKNIGDMGFDKSSMLSYADAMSQLSALSVRSANGVMGVKTDADSVARDSIEQVEQIINGKISERANELSLGLDLKVFSFDATNAIAALRNQIEISLTGIEIPTLTFATVLGRGSSGEGTNMNELMMRQTFGSAFAKIASNADQWSAASPSVYKLMRDKIVSGMGEGLQELASGESTLSDTSSRFGELEYGFSFLEKLLSESSSQKDNMQARVDAARTKVQAIIDSKGIYKNNATDVFTLLDKAQELINGYQGGQTEVNSSAFMATLSAVYPEIVKIENEIDTLNGKKITIQAEGGSVKEIDRQLKDAQSRLDSYHEQLRSTITKSDASTISKFDKLFTRQSGGRVGSVQPLNNRYSTYDQSKDYVVFDFETTGTDIETSRIVQIAAKRVRDGQIVDTFDEYVNPGMHMPEGATEINGIRDDQLQNARPIAKVLSEFLDFIDDDLLVGHNIGKFDIPILSRVMAENKFGVLTNKFTDTLSVAESIYGDKGGNKLTDLAQKFGISTAKAHDAGGDTEMNQQVYEQLMPLFKGFEELEPYQDYIKRMGIDEWVDKLTSTQQSNKDKVTSAKSIRDYFKGQIETLRGDKNKSVSASEMSELERLFSEMNAKVEAFERNPASSKYNYDLRNGSAGQRTILEYRDMIQSRIDEYMEKSTGLTDILRSGGVRFDGRASGITKQIKPITTNFDSFFAEEAKSYINEASLNADDIASFKNLQHALQESAKLMATDVSSFQEAAGDYARRYRSAANGNTPTKNPIAASKSDEILLIEKEVSSRLNTALNESVAINKFRTIEGNYIPYLKEISGFDSLGGLFEASKKSAVSSMSGFESIIGSFGSKNILSGDSLNEYATNMINALNTVSRFSNKLSGNSELYSAFIASDYIFSGSIYDRGTASDLLSSKYITQSIGSDGVATFELNLEKAFELSERINTAIESFNSKISSGDESGAAKEKTNIENLLKSSEQYMKIVRSRFSANNVMSKMMTQLGDSGIAAENRDAVATAARNTARAALAEMYESADIGDVTDDLVARVVRNAVIGTNIDAGLYGNIAEYGKSIYRRNMSVITSKSKYNQSGYTDGLSAANAIIGAFENVKSNVSNLRNIESVVSTLQESGYNFDAISSNSTYMQSIRKKMNGASSYEALINGNFSGFNKDVYGIVADMLGQKTMKIKLPNEDESKTTIGTVGSAIKEAISSSQIVNTNGSDGSSLSLDASELNQLSLSIASIISNMQRYSIGDLSNASSAIVKYSNLRYQRANGHDAGIMGLANENVLLKSGYIDSYEQIKNGNGIFGLIPDEKRQKLAIGSSNQKSIDYVLNSIIDSMVKNISGGANNYSDAVRNAITESGMFDINKAGSILYKLKDSGATLFNLMPNNSFTNKQSTDSPDLSIQTFATLIDQLNDAGFSSATKFVDKAFRYQDLSESINSVTERISNETVKEEDYQGLYDIIQSIASIKIDKKQISKSGVYSADQINAIWNYIKNILSGVKGSYEISSEFSTLDENGNAVLDGEKLLGYANSLKDYLGQYFSAEATSEDNRNVAKTFDKTFSRLSTHNVPASQEAMYDYIQSLMGRNDTVSKMLSVPNALNKGISTYNNSLIQAQTDLVSGYKTVVGELFTGKNADTGDRILNLGSSSSKDIFASLSEGLFGKFNLPFNIYDAGNFMDNVIDSIYSTIFKDSEAELGRLKKLADVGGGSDKERYDLYKLSRDRILGSMQNSMLTNEGRANLQSYQSLFELMQSYSNDFKTLYSGMPGKGNASIYDLLSSTMMKSYIDPNNHNNEGILGVKESLIENAAKYFSKNDLTSLFNSSVSSDTDTIRTNLSTKVQELINGFMSNYESVAQANAELLSIASSGLTSINSETISTAEKTLGNFGIDKDNEISKLLSNAYTTNQDGSKVEGTEANKYRYNIAGWILNTSRGETTTEDMATSINSDIQNYSQLMNNAMSAIEMLSSIQSMYDSSNVAGLVQELSNSFDGGNAPSYISSILPELQERIREKIRSIANVDDIEKLRTGIEQAVQTEINASIDSITSIAGNNVFKNLLGAKYTKTDDKTVSDMRSVIAAAQAAGYDEKYGKDSGNLAGKNILDEYAAQLAKAQNEHRTWDLQSLLSGRSIGEYDATKASNILKSYIANKESYDIAQKSAGSMKKYIDAISAENFDYSKYQKISSGKDGQNLGEMLQGQMEKYVSNFNNKRDTYLNELLNPDRDEKVFQTAKSEYDAAKRDLTNFHDILTGNSTNQGKLLGLVEERGTIGESSSASEKQLATNIDQAASAFVSLFDMVSSSTGTIQAAILNFNKSLNEAARLYNKSDKAATAATNETSPETRLNTILAYNTKLESMSGKLKFLNESGVLSSGDYSKMNGIVEMAMSGLAWTDKSGNDIKYGTQTVKDNNFVSAEQFKSIQDYYNENVLPLYNRMQDLSSIYSSQGSDFKGLSHLRRTTSAYYDAFRSNQANPDSLPKDLNELLSQYNSGEDIFKKLNIGAGDDIGNAFGRMFTKLYGSGGLMGSLNALNGSVSGGSDADSVYTLRDAWNTALAAAEAYFDYVKGSGQYSVTDKMASDLSAKMSDVSKVYTDLEKNKGASYQDKITWASIVSKMSNLQSQLDAAKATLDEQMKSAKTKEEQDKARESYTNTVKNIKSQYDVATNTTYEGKLRDAERMYASIKGFLAGGGAANDPERHANLTQYADSLDSMIARFRNGKISATQFSQAIGVLTNKLAEIRANAGSLDLTGTKMANISSVQNYITKMTQLLNGQYKHFTPQSTKVIQDKIKELQTGIGNGGVKQNTYQSIQDTISGLVMRETAQGNNGRNFMDIMGGRAMRILSNQIVSRVFMHIRQLVSTLISEVSNIDSAMTQLQIVTGNTDTTMQTFFQSAIDSSKELSASVTDVMESIETFSRLGYDLTDSTDLAEAATVMSNVADTSVDDSTTGITAIMEGFDIEADQAMNIADKLVAVGQSYPVSASELMTALEKGGSSMAAANNSLEESIALIAAGNASVQDASTVGTALKTMTARIRSSTAELDEMGEDYDGLVSSASKYRKEIMALSGVDIMANETEYKSTYQIIKEIAQVWDKMTDVSQATLLEDLAGKRNTNVVLSMITNLDTLEGAYESASDASGTATDAQDTYNDSVAAHKEQMTNELSILASDAIPTDALIIFYDVLTKVLEVLDEIAKLATTPIGQISIFAASMLKLSNIIGSNSVLGSLLFGSGDMTAKDIWGLKRNPFTYVKNSAAMMGNKAGLFAKTQAKRAEEFAFGTSAEGTGIREVEYIVDDTSVAEADTKAETPVTKDVEYVADDTSVAEADTKAETPVTKDVEYVADDTSVAEAESAAETPAVKETEFIVDDASLMAADTEAEMPAAKEIEFIVDDASLIRSNAEAETPIVKEIEYVADKPLTDDTSKAIGTGFTGISLGIIAAIALISAIKGKYDDYVEGINDAISTLSDSSEELTESRKSLEDYKDSIAEYKNDIASGSLSEEELYEAQSSLLDISDEINESYSDQISNISSLNGGINTLTSSYSELSSQLDQVSQKLAVDYVSEHANDIETAYEKYSDSMFFDKSFALEYSYTGSDANNIASVLSENGFIDDNNDSTTGNSTRETKELELDTKDYENSLAKIDEIISNIKSKNVDGIYDDLITSLETQRSDFVEQYEAAYESMTEAGEYVIEQYQQGYDLISDMTEARDAFTDAMSEGNFDIDLYDSMMSSSESLWSGYSQVIANETDANKAAAKMYIQSMQNEMNEIQDQYQALYNLQNSLNEGLSTSPTLTTTTRDSSSLGSALTERDGGYSSSIFGDGNYRIVFNPDVTFNGEDGETTLSSSEIRNYLDTVIDKAINDVGENEYTIDAILAIDASGTVEGYEGLSGVIEGIGETGSNTLTYVNGNPDMSSYENSSYYRKLEYDAALSEYNTALSAENDWYEILGKNLTFDISESTGDIAGVLNTLFDYINTLETDNSKYTDVNKYLSSIGYDTSEFSGYDDTYNAIKAVLSYVESVQLTRNARYNMNEKFNAYNDTASKNTGIDAINSYMVGNSGVIDNYSLLNDATAWLNGLTDLSQEASDRIEAIRDYAEDLGFEDLGTLEGWEALVDALGKTSQYETIASAASKTLTYSYEDLSDAASNLSTILTDSAGATGLTDDDLTNLEEYFSDIIASDEDGYEQFNDINQILWKTSSGLRINSSALSEWIDKENKFKTSDMKSYLEEQVDLYNDLSDKIEAAAASGNNQLVDSLKVQQSNVEDNINSVENLISQYEGLTNAYNAFNSAVGSTTQNREQSDTVTQNWETVGKELDLGMGTSDTVTTFLDYMLGEHGDTYEENLELFEGLNSNNGKNGHSIADYYTVAAEGAEDRYGNDISGQLTSQGWYNLRDDLIEAGAYTSDGQMVEDVWAKGSDYVAGLLGNGLSGEAMLDIMQNAASDAGIFKLDDIQAMYGIDTSLNGPEYSTGAEYEDALAEAINNRDQYQAELTSLQDYYDSLVEGGASEEELAKAAERIEEASDNLNDASDKVDELEELGENQTTGSTYQANTDFSNYSEYLQVVDAIQSDINSYETELANMSSTGTSADGTYYKQVEADLAAAQQALADVKSQGSAMGFDFDIDDMSESYSDFVSQVGEAGTALEGVEAASENIASNLAKAGDGAEAISSACSTVVDLGTESLTITLETDDANAKLSTLQEAADAWDSTDASATLSITDSASSSISTVTSGLSRIYALITKINSSKITPGGGYAAGTAAFHLGSFAFANGNAFDHGSDISTRFDGNALGGELGQEMVVRDGRWFTIGDNGPEFFHYRKGDIIFNASQTKDLLSSGKTSTHGHAYASGNAYNEYVSSSVILTSYKGVKSVASGTTSSSSGSGDDDDDKTDWIEVAIDRIERVIENLSEIAENAFQLLSTRLDANAEEITNIIKEIDLQQQGATRYLEEANKSDLSEDIKELVRNGAIDIESYDEDTQEDIKDYQEWYEKYLDCLDSEAELRERIGELYKDQFDMYQTDFENQLSILEHEQNEYNSAMSTVETEGYFASVEYYKKLQELSQSRLDIMKKEAEQLKASLDEAVNSGYMDKYSEEWYEMVDAINSVYESMQDEEEQIAEDIKAIRELNDSYFDFKQQLNDDLTTEMDFLTKLLDKEILVYDKDDEGETAGTFSEAGMATLGLYAMQYDTYMRKAEEYGEERAKLYEELQTEDGKYNKDLIERWESLTQSQQDAISSAEDVKDSMKDLVQDGIDKELDALQELIDEYNDALDSEKDMYDYQKKIQEGSKNVADIQKQLAAYSGDTSEETKATVQKLKEDLEDAQENLKSDQWDRMISETGEILDDLYDEYEEILNARLDDVDALVAELITDVNDNSDSIVDTIRSEAQDVNYDITEALGAALTTSVGFKDLVSSYCDGFTNQYTSMIYVLDRIEDYIEALVANSDATAQTYTGTDSSAGSVSTESTNTQTTVAPVATTGTSSSISSDSSTTAWSPDLSNYKTIKYGATGDKVKEMQKLLIALGYSVGSTGADGIWGSQTMAGLKAFQIAYGVGTNPQGKTCGTGTWTALLTAAHEKGISGYSAGGYVGKLKRISDLNGDDGFTINTLKQGEAILTPEQAEQFSQLISNMPVLNNLVDGLEPLANVPNSINSGSGVDVGGINITIPIERVEDYNDFVTQLKKDDKFEKMIRSMTVDTLTGGSKMAKNKYTW